MIAMPGPIITLAERSDIIATNALAPLIKTIPSMWDETIVCGQSQIGEVTAMARRKALDWYVAVMNLNSFRSLSIPLTFLAPYVTYQVTYVRDSSSAPESLTKTQNDSLPVFANAGGGEAARFTPIATNYPPVTLQITNSGESLQLVWSIGTLLESTNADGPWSTNSSATSPWPLTLTGERKFYRVRVQ